MIYLFVTENLILKWKLNTSEAFLKPQIRPPLPSERPKFDREWTLQGIQSVPQGCWPMWTLMLPTVVKSTGCPWTILDPHGKLLRVKNPAALQFLTQTAAHGTYYHTPFKGTSIFCLAYSPSEWNTHTIHVSRLRNPSLTGLLCFIYMD